MRTPHLLMRSALLTLAAGLLAPLCGCIYVDSPDLHGNGLYVSEDRTGQIENFDEISLDGSADVEVSIDPSLSEPSVVVYTDENLLPYILTEVRSDRLHIGARRSYSTRNGLRVAIATPSLSLVALRGSGTITAGGIDAQSFVARVSGSGDINLAGRSSDLDLAVTGSGTIHAADLEAQSADVDISGSGNVSLLVRQEAWMTIGGSGNINCYGDPPRYSQRVTGSGNISFR